MQQTKRIKNALCDMGSRPLQGTFLLLGDRSTSCGTVRSPQLTADIFSSISEDVQSARHSGGK